MRFWASGSGKMDIRLTREDEFPVTNIPDLPLWSENYCFDGYDGASGIGFWLHIGRPSHHRELLCELIYIYLPDDEFLVYKNYSRNIGQVSPIGSALSFECVEPYRTWKLHYFGIARHVTRAELMSGPFADGVSTLVEFDIDWNAITPVWNIGAKAEKQIWCTGHYEQAGAATGRLRFEGKTFEFRSAAYRDHSRGPRDVSQMLHHAWIHGSFPDGRAFGMFEMRVLGAQERNLSEGFVFADGKMYEAAIGSAPLLRTQDDVYRPYELLMTGEFGEYGISGVPQHSVPQSLRPPNENMLGTVEDASHLVFQESTQFQLGGATGHGHTERSLRLSPAR
jgi:hypothetical protein